MAHFVRLIHPKIVDPHSVTLLQTMEANPAKQQTLFVRLGGVAAVRAVVDQFYVRVLGDDKLYHFFEGVNMSHLKLHQLKFLRMAFTEIPKNVNVKSMIIKKHCELFVDKGLNETHFDLVAGHLVDALQHLGVSSDLIAESLAVVAPLRPIFVETARNFQNSIATDGAALVKESEQCSNGQVKKSKSRRRMSNSTEKHRRSFLSRIWRSKTKGSGATVDG